MTDSIHLLDRVSWLLDEPLKLVGQVARKMDRDSKVEDCSELLCSSFSGIPAVIGSFFSFSKNKTLEDNLTVYGTKGTLVIHAWSHLEWTPHGQPMQRIEGYEKGLELSERAAVGHQAALEEFAAAITDNRRPESDCSLILNAQELVERFYEAEAAKKASNA